MIKSIISSILAILFTGAMVFASTMNADQTKKKTDDLQLDPAKQKMVFLTHAVSVNVTNGRATDAGFYIDEKGNVYKFDRRAKKNKWQFASKPIISGHVDSATLTEKRRLIEQIAASGIFQEEHSKFDAGSYSISAFMPDAKSGEYLEIKLSKKGDFEGQNSASETKKLIEWLQSVAPKSDTKDLVEWLNGSSGK